MVNCTVVLLIKEWCCLEFLIVCLDPLFTLLDPKMNGGSLHSIRYSR